MLRHWLVGALRHRSGRLVGMALGIALAVALIAAIGGFLAASQATMTARTVANVAVDWQVQLRADVNQSAARDTVRSQPGVTAALPVGFASSTGFSATTGATTQTTGTGVVLGLVSNYHAVFPMQIRPLVGQAGGVLLAQQTAANLHVRPGDVVSVGRSGLQPVDVVVDGVVELPNADTLFQTVGAPAGAQPTAPPDNVMLIPETTWHTMFDAMATARPDLIKQQIHVRLAHDLPSSPATAFEQVSAAARNLETRLAGAGQVGNNLAAALDAARSDAAYATVVFLFLGLPGVALAAVLTSVVAASGAQRRRREQALLRARGARVSVIGRLATAEALLAGLFGVLLGLAVAAVLSVTVFGSVGRNSDSGTTMWWMAAAAIVGLTIALLIIAVPAWRDARRQSVAATRESAGRQGIPSWLRLSLAAMFIAAAIAVFAVTSQSGYQLVLAPEGVPKISVDYFAFLGPACLWVGIALIVWRAAEVVLLRGRRLLASIIRRAAGALGGVIASAMSRQHRLIAPAVVMVAVTTAFATSTAVFNSTYQQQAEVDARLTNGGDVTLRQLASAPLPRASETTLASIRGVRHVEPLLHRFAYVGADLQDLFGVRASTIVTAGSLQDAYFQGGTATQVMAQLGAHHDGILVSAETVKDFQLQPGDQLLLRLQDTRSNQLVPVRFRYVGIVKEFPTAPRDSFLVANADYVAAATHNPVLSTYLIETGGASPQSVAATVRALVGPGWQVTDINTTRGVVGSSLTAVDLNGITRIELSFALAFMLAATGLLIGLGFAERRRVFAIAVAIGARPRQLASFMWSEAGFVLIAGVQSGLLAGWLISQMLVVVLNGVFDPPPESLAVPWGYLAALLLASVIASAVAVASAARLLTIKPVSVIRAY
jgi:putative ABC transport system permease protein